MCERESTRVSECIARWLSVHECLCMSVCLCVCVRILPSYITVVWYGRSALSCLVSHSHALACVMCESDSIVCVCRSSGVFVLCIVYCVLCVVLCCVVF